MLNLSFRCYTKLASATIQNVASQEILIIRKMCSRRLYQFRNIQQNKVLAFPPLYRKYLCKSFYRTISFTPFSRTNENSEDNNASTNSIFQEQCFNDVPKHFIHPGVGHKVLLIQPRIKYGSDREKKTVSELKLSEAVSLVNTLKDWKVVEKLIVPVAHIKSSLLFGSGNLEKLKLMIHQDPRITAVFIGTDVLTSIQNTKLESYFKVQVFDRYQVILQIFHEHAKTKEAKLQLALAEIPYLRIKLCSYSHTRSADTFSGIHHVGGDGESFMETRRRILNERELKLKKEIEKIKTQREFLRQSDMRNSYPIVAIVGYTNCGKTTLIKSLTDDKRLVPEDKLFATLDVTIHPGVLPSNQKVLFVDTVGFISDVPTALIQSFRSTLEEINVADLVIHIRDISHPDTETQKKTVLKTLEELNLPPALLESIVEVRNKVDLIEGPMPSDDSDAIHISATEGTGLSNLLEVIEQKLFENTGHSYFLLRIPNGGIEYSWILKEAALRDVMADPEDANYLIAEVVMSAKNLGIFIHKFGDLRISVEDIKIKS